MSLGLLRMCSFPRCWCCCGADGDSDSSGDGGTSDGAAADSVTIEWDGEWWKGEGDSSEGKRDGMEAARSPRPLGGGDAEADAACAAWPAAVECAEAAAAAVPPSCCCCLCASSRCTLACHADCSAMRKGDRRGKRGRCEVCGERRRDKGSGGSAAAGAWRASPSSAIALHGHIATVTRMPATAHHARRRVGIASHRNRNRNRWPVAERAVAAAVRCCSGRWTAQGEREVAVDWLLSFHSPPSLAAAHPTLSRSQWRAAL